MTAGIGGGVGLGVGLTEVLGVVVAAEVDLGPVLVDREETLMVSLAGLPWMLLVFEGIETEERVDLGSGIAVWGACALYAGGP